MEELLPGEIVALLPFGDRKMAVIQLGDLVVLVAHRVGAI